jgi:(S)-ureidoglycine aminohydrolase
MPFAVIPKGTYSDIVTSFLPFWTGMRMWVIARPMSGFAETFSHYIVELTSGGGSDRPEDDEEAQAVLFVTAGSLRVTYEGKEQAAGYRWIRLLACGQPLERAQSNK